MNTIVTGAGSGIGRALAVELAARGHALALVGRSVEKLHGTATACAAANAGCRALVMAGDLADSAFAAGVVDRTVAELGGIDVLVNCAGVAPHVPIEGTDEDVLEEAFLNNAFGPAFLIVRAWPHFLQRKAGCVVNVSSLASSDPFNGFFAYGAAKSALDSYVRSMHREGARHGIRAFCLNLGAVETPMLRSNFPASAVPESMTLPPEAVAEVIADCLAGRRDADRGKNIVVKR